MPRSTRSTDCPSSDAPAPPAFDVVAIAASAGGLTSLSSIVAALPCDFPAAVLIVQHLDPRHRSLMAEILGRRTPCRVQEAADGQPILAGGIYVAPPDRHLLVTPHRAVSLTETELVHFVRPSADLLFESGAATYRERAIAVVVSGTGQDGAMGVRAVKNTGGTVIVEDESTATFFGMPGAAVQTGCVDFALPIAEIGPALVTLVMKGEVE